ncbi:MAG: methylenetetrahydrofolate reductase C-terminal domain-containing protein [Elusimicrobiota bacterium]|nr:methylenetetrahydrofolate reductase C-terminal domain-containing protein [Elusimicrobiota bacterium]
MIISQQKPFEEILKMLEGEKSIFIVGCNGCAEVCETGGEKACQELKKKLEEAKIKVDGCTTVDFMCNKLLVALKISRYKEKIDKADSVIALTCGIGVQSVASVVDKYVHPANNTVFLGGFQGTWPSAERCAQCGECVLDLTGGICPITNCSKSLLNGSCGGAKNGKCEIDKELDCGWENIYNRLKKLNKPENLQKFSIKLRDYSKMFPKAELRKTTFYDIEK